MALGEMNAGMLGFQESQMKALSPAQGRGAERAFKGGDFGGGGHSRERFFSTPGVSFHVQEALLV